MINLQVLMIWYNYPELVMIKLNDRIVFDFSNGDTDAFTKIYRHYQPALFLYAMNFVKNKEDAEDILATVFVRLWEGRATFKDVKNLEGYVMTMVRNACLNFMRRERIKAEVEGDMAQRLEAEAKEAFIRARIHAEMAEFVNKEVKKLSPKYRTVYKLSFVEGLGNQEIADRLDLTDQMVRNIKSRIRKTLRLHFLENSLAVIYLLLSFKIIFIGHSPCFSSHEIRSVLSFF